ncbi:MAG: hypothetical protein IAE85_15950 [Anaerolinea sp.]|nr:hypothetical protein [Anaerolinea sp.]
MARFLTPIDALTAAIYSILIVLTFTLTFTVIKRWPGYNQPIPEGFSTELFYAVLGASVAWALIDGLMLALLSLLERSEKHRFLQALQAADSDEDSLAVIADEFDFVLEPIASETKRHQLYADVLEHLRDSQPRPVGFQREDFIEALGTALVAMLAVLPSLLPLWLLRDDPLAALRGANIVSFVMLFILGYRWGVYTGANRWKTGLLLPSFGLALVAIAIPLGG